MMYIQTNKDAPHMMHLIQPGTVGAEIGVWMGLGAPVAVHCATLRRRTPCGHEGRGSPRASLPGIIIS